MFPSEMLEHNLEGTLRIIGTTGGPTTANLGIHKSSLCFRTTPIYVLQEPGFGWIDVW